MSELSLTPEQSRRNVLVSSAACGIGFTGFTLVMPFLPLYIQQLGVTDVGQIAMWTGLTLGATPAVTAFSAPLWGRVGDRYGSKLLVLRSLGAFVITKAAMAFVTAPWQLFALRALLGLFAGYGALTMSMAAESVPRDRMASAIGIVQVGQRLGPAVGPVLGGVLAPLVGLRAAFLLAAGFYFLAALLVAIVYKEPRERQARSVGRPLREVFAQLVRLPGFMLLLGVILSLQLVDRSFGPILPLFVAELGYGPSGVLTVSGVLFSIAAAFAAVGHKVAGGLLERFSPRVLITTASWVTALTIAALMLIPSVWVFGVALACGGVAIGVGMTAAYSVAGGLLPPDAHATGFGLMTTASLIGLAVSPVVAGFLGAADLEVVFAADVLLLAALAVIVRARMTPAIAAPREPHAPDASEA